MDIPRIFNIMESAHRIHNPFTPEKFATLGAALRLEPGTRVLDLGSGSGEMLCTWARDHGIIGTGVDMSQLFSEQAKLGPKNSVSPIRSSSSMTMLRAIFPTRRSMWRPVWALPGSPGASPVRLNFWPRACALTESSSSVSPTGGSYRQPKRLPKDVLPAPLPTFSYFLILSRLSAVLATMSLKWCWPIQTTSSQQRFEPNSLRNPFATPHTHASIWAGGCSH